MHRLTEYRASVDLERIQAGGIESLKLIELLENDEGVQAALLCESI